ncbi:MAG: HAMP domain-containing histidine kinase [Candidatus Hydrogenedentes bacterium]|nr:HAMP domain-containing histidine kinase [Candidatus Hydrogenedentota bacterium]
MDTLDLQSDAFQQRLMLLFRHAMVGRCVNGVTHDVNNYLGAVLAYAELIGYEENLSAESRRMLDEIVDGIKRSSDLMGTLTGIARKDRQRVSLTHIEELLRHTVQLQQYNNRLAQTQVETVFHETPRAVPANAPRLELAFQALLLNAMEAVEGAPRRIIRIRTDYDASCCTVEFWDSGSGMGGESAENYFAPFTTTKDEFHLGLGLAFARQVVQEHGGTLAYQPGTGIVVGLPLENGMKPSLF